VILVAGTLDFRAGAGPFHCEKIKFHNGTVFVRLIRFQRPQYSSVNNCISILKSRGPRGAVSVPIGAALCRE
jgi:hypothetical protein